MKKIISLLCSFSLILAFLLMNGHASENNPASKGCEKTRNKVIKLLRGYDPGQRKYCDNQAMNTDYTMDIMNSIGFDKFHEMCKCFPE